MRPVGEAQLHGEVANEPRQVCREAEERAEERQEGGEEGGLWEQMGRRLGELWPLHALRPSTRRTMEKPLLIGGLRGFRRLMNVPTWMRHGAMRG